MCFASSAKRTFPAPTVASMIAESISSPNLTKTSGNVRAFFINKEKSAEDNLKWRVTVANVKMCEMIAEMNLPLATADSLEYFDR